MGPEPRPRGATKLEPTEGRGGGKGTGCGMTGAGKVVDDDDDAADVMN